MNKETVVVQGDKGRKIYGPTCVLPWEDTTWTKSKNKNETQESIQKEDVFQDGEFLIMSIESEIFVREEDK